MNATQCHIVEITEFYCNDIVAKVPSNQFFTQKFILNCLTKKTLRGSEFIVFPYFPHHSVEISAI